MNARIKNALHAHVQSHYPILYLVTHDEAEADTLILELMHEDNRKIVEWNMAQGLINFETRQASMDYIDLASALDLWLIEDQLNNHFIVIRDAHLGLREQPLAVARLKALVRKISEDKDGVVTIFLIGSQALIPPELEKLITLFDLPLPDETAIRGVIDEYVQAYDLPIEADITSKLALALQGLTRLELGQLISRGIQQGGYIGLETIDMVQEEKRQIIKKSGILEMLTVSEKLDDIGGLEKLKPWLQHKSKIMNNWSAARAFGVEPPKGMMIVGMPGCGKSLTAKATAALFNLPLLKLDIGSLMGKYVGESEANMRRALKMAEAVSPCVLWVDELEKAFVGIGGDGGGAEVSTRLFGYFLTWMQEKTQQVFVVATANNISALPPELLRKGRFDEIFYVDFPNESDRLAIFKVHLTKRKQTLARIALPELARATDGYSGADIESVVKEAIEQAFVDKCTTLNTQRLLDVVKQTHPLRDIMKTKLDEYSKRFKEMKIKSAS